jgi:hypothetical protein
VWLMPCYFDIVRCSHFQGKAAESRVSSRALLHWAQRRHFRSAVARVLRQWPGKTGPLGPGEALLHCAVRDPDRVPYLPFAQANPELNLRMSLVFGMDNLF